MGVGVGGMGVVRGGGGRCCGGPEGRVGGDSMQKVSMYLAGGQILVIRGYSLVIIYPPINIPAHSQQWLFEILSTSAVDLNRFCDRTDSLSLCLFHPSTQFFILNGSICDPSC